MRKALLLSLLAVTTTLRAQTPQLVYDICAGPNFSNPVWLTGFKGKLHFFANDGTNGFELWSYAYGSTPTMVCDLNPGNLNGGPFVGDSHMAVLNNKLYFCGNNGITGSELYVYDGINPPTIVADISLGLTSSGPSEFFTLGNKLYFRAGTNTNGAELYIYDGTNPPVMKELRPGTLSTSPTYMTEFNGKLYFSGYTPSNGEELCMYDPATDSIKMAQDIISGIAPSMPRSLHVANGKLYFTALTPAYGHELYSYDGTTSTRVTDVAPGGNDGARGPIVALNNMIYFSGSTDGLKRQLYKYDPATGNATLVYNINAGRNAAPAELCVYLNKLYFAANDSASGTEIWVTDGTTTHMVTDLNPGTASSLPTDFYVFNNRLYLRANNGTSGLELYRISDPAGIQQVSFDGDVRLYPNPSKHSATLEVTLQRPHVLSIQLIDMMGKRVWVNESCNYGTGRNEVTLPLDGLVPGTYFYHIIGTGKRQLFAGKVVKE